MNEDRYGQQFWRFLSTLSLRRATILDYFSAVMRQFLSTLSLRRATVIKKTVTFNPPISIHALLAESDLILHMAHLMELLFLSTLSLRRATSAFDVLAVSALLISIHALLAESDKFYYFALPVLFYFYPRSPCGERHLDAGQPGYVYRISIHALLAESD